MDEATIPDAARRPTAVAMGPRWNDLREWLALVEQHGSLARITGEVDPNEELGAITFMASRRKISPAFLFETLPGQSARRTRALEHAGREQAALRARGRPRSGSLHRRDGGSNAPHHQEARAAGVRAAGGCAGQRSHPARRRSRPYGAAGADLLAGRRRRVHRNGRRHHHPPSAVRATQCGLLPAAAPLARGGSA